MAKNNANNELSQDEKVYNEMKTQFEQSMAGLTVLIARLDYLALVSLKKEDYQQILKNVAEFSKNICKSK